MYPVTSQPHRRGRLFKTGTGLVALVLVAIGAWSQEIPRIQSPIVIDGKVSPEEWDGVDTLSFVSHWPVYAPAKNTNTKFRIGYDDKYLYFSSICYDDPGLIQGPTFERDKWEMTMDQMAVILDTYNDNENALVFSVTPTGSRIDVAMKNDAQGDEPADVSWNSYWIAEAATHDRGWSMEARIPFSSLRFQTTGDEVNMGLIVYRYVARDRKLDIYPPIRPDWGFWSFAKPSQAANITFRGVRNKRPWFTTPYLLSRLGYHHTETEPGSMRIRERDNTVTAGLDVQHALTDNLNLDFTINTDFAQVEADDQIVNLSRFSLFFPEKRRFFLERSSIMEFGFEQNNRLFYSRRIGLDEGRIVPLWGGARLVGRIGNYDVGVMNLQSRKVSDVPSENFGVLRVRRRVSRNNSYVGGIFTSRTNLNGSHDVAYGADAIVNLFKNDYLRVNLAQTYHSGDTVDYASALSDRKRIFVMWENRSQVGLNYSLSYSQVDKHYSPALGFEARNNFRAVGDRVSYGWFPKKEGSLRYLSASLNATGFFRNPVRAAATTQPARLETFQLSPSFLMEWVKNNTFTVTFNRLYDSPGEAFALSDEITIPAGTYVNQDVNVSYQSPTVNFLTSLFDLTTGTFYGGKRFSGGITPTWIINKYVTLSAFYQFNRIDFADKPDYLAHVARLKVATSLNVKLSVNAFAQTNTVSNVSAINFRFRYNWRDGDDLYVVYNEVLNNDAKIDAYLPFSDYRAFIVKYVHTFHVGN